MDEKTFGEKINEDIIGPPKKRVTITFPEEVFAELDKYSKENSADCYWLAIKQLLDFFVEQKTGDLKTVMIMQAVNEVKSDVEELKDKMFQLEHPKKDETHKTFGKKEVKNEES